MSMSLLSQPAPQTMPTHTRPHTKIKTKALLFPLSNLVTPIHICLPVNHQPSTLGSPDTVWSFRSHKLEVSPRHTSQHKQFGTCNVMSIPLNTRQMLLLFCHSNISQQLENLRDPVALHLNVN